MSKRSFALALLLPTTLAALAACSDEGTAIEGRDGDRANGATSAGTNGSNGPSASGNNTADNGTSGSAPNGSSTGTSAGSQTPVPTSTTLPAAQGGNPFVGATQYVRPDYIKQVEGSIAKAPANADQLRKMEAFSTALWLDRIAKVKDLGPLLDGALAEQKKSGKPVVSTVVVYDLPDRDCAANSSAGELASANGGLAKYKTDYIDAIAAVLKAHVDQRVVLVIEPDGLPNLATNLGVAKCATAAPIYREAVAYAVSTLSMPHTFLYLDAAHSGWLGWDEGRTKAAAVFKEVLTMAGGASKIRGFATNVSNYTPLNVANPDTHPEAFYDFNPVRDEASFVAKFAQDLAAAGLPAKFLIDTSRNGVPSTRTVWGNWCNIVGAGIGQRPQAAPTTNVDAYVWIKTPGESDGVSDPNAQRYDAKCSSVDSAKNAPQAGEWFHDYFLDLVKNASPAL
jgi:cellulose 1,4-beta-cellobiosidase